MEGFYYTIPSDIFFDKNLSDKAKLLFGLVANFCNKYGKCYVSNKYLGETLDRSESTISRLVGELVDAGYIKSIVDKNEHR
jgi:predicted transcriptional regulator